MGSSHLFFFNPHAGDGTFKQYVKRGGTWRLTKEGDEWLASDKTRANLHLVPSRYFSDLLISAERFVASLLSSKCDCGYEAEAWVASSRAGHGKHFRWPFLCRGCRQVVSVDVYADSGQCPQCESPEISRYGLLIPDPPSGKAARILDAMTATRRRYNKQVANLYESRVEMAYAARTNTTYGLPRQAYECPSCGGTVLTFRLEALVD